MKLTLTLAKILLKEVLEVWRPGKEAATGKWNSQHLSLSGTGCSHWPCQLWAPTAAGITGHLTPLRMDWMMLGCYCFTIAVEGVWLGEPQSHSCASTAGGQKEETQKLQVPWGGGCLASTQALLGTPPKEEGGLDAEQFNIWAQYILIFISKFSRTPKIHQFCYMKIA